MKKISGYTLIELLITAVVVSLIMAVGVPSVTLFIKNDRLSTQINTLVGHLALARSEAVTRHLPVIICASSNSTSCGGDWSDGWILFTDVDNSGTRSADEDIIRVQQELKGDNTLSNTTGAIVTYDERGFSPNSTGTFSLCDDRGSSYMKSITISNTGRVRKGGSSSC